MTRNRAFILMMSLAVGATLGTSVRAEDTVHTDTDHMSHFKIYLGPAYVAPMGDSDVTLGTVTNSIEAEKQVGWNLGFEGRFNKLLGIELDYVNANQDVSFGGSTIGDTTFSPLTATLNFHVLPFEHFDLYLGPSYTYVNWGDVHVNVSTGGISGGSTIGTDSSHGWGASLGFDVNPWEHIGFYAGLKYLDVDLQMNNGQTADVNPLVGRLGVSFRF